MCDEELHKISEMQMTLEEVVKSLLNLNSDLFWLLMQHVSTDELREKLEERQRIDDAYSKIAD